MRNLLLTSLFCLIVVGTIQPAKSFFFKKSYLIIPYIDLSIREQDVFDKYLVPWFDKGGYKLINVGTAEHPWWCVEFRWRSQAERDKELMSRPSWSRSIAEKSFIEDNCAAG